MPYRKYPWHRFQYWLRQHPNNAIAGTRHDYLDNVVARFLNERIGREFSVGRYMLWPDYQGVPNIYGEAPEWVHRFLFLINADSNRERYTFVTCRRIMRQVSEELRYGHK